MKKTFEASLSLILAAAATAAILAVILPAHPRLDMEPARQLSNIVPAVFDPVLHQRPGAAGRAGDPVEAATGCPYLESSDAAVSCPALPQAKAGTSCPFLDGHQEGSQRDGSTSLFGKHT